MSNALTTSWQQSSEEIINHLIKVVIDLEGGFSNHKNDLGGQTNLGITESLAREYGYTGKIMEMKERIAHRIYREEFIKPMMIEEFARDSINIGLILLVCAVNIGKNRMIRNLQTSLNALNNMQEMYNDITVDGLVGNNTLKAYRCFLDKRGENGKKILCSMLLAMVGEHYVNIASKREANESFLYGWFNRIEKLKEIVS